MKLRVVPDQLDDRIFELLNIHQGHFSSWAQLNRDMMLQCLQTLPYDTFKREMLGQFCEPYPLSFV